MTGVWLLWEKDRLCDVFRTEDGAKSVAEKNTGYYSDELHWHDARALGFSHIMIPGEDYLCTKEDGECNPTEYSVEFRHWL